ARVVWKQVSRRPAARAHESSERPVLRKTREVGGAVLPLRRMGSASAGPALPACPHCREFHPERVLVCPSTRRVLPLAGRLLEGKFRFRRPLGEGGMGAVWKAENELVHRTVAIKLLHPEYARNDNTLERFRQEATAAGRIRDPHICDILDLGQSELGPFIVM